VYLRADACGCLLISKSCFVRLRHAIVCLLL